MSVPITPGTGASSVAAEVVSGLNYQKIELVNAGATNTLAVNADGSVNASIVGIPSISGTVGASIIGVAPVNIITNAGSQGADGSSYIQLSLPGGGATSNPIPTAGFLYNGSSWDRVRGNSSNGMLVNPYAFSASLISGVTSVMQTTASVTVLQGAPGGQRNYVTQLLATNGGAVGTFVNIYDAGQVVYSGYAAASGGGFSASFPAPLRQSSAQGALCAATVSTSSVIVAASGYTAP